MRKLCIAVEKVNSLAAFLYLIGLALYYFMGFPDLWISLIIITGVVLLIRQFLLGQMVDCLFILIVFGGAFAAYYWFFYPWYVIPGLLAVGSLYIIIAQISRYWLRFSKERREHTSSHLIDE